MLARIRLDAYAAAASCEDQELDDLFVQASQSYEQACAQEEEGDLSASQQVHSSTIHEPDDFRACQIFGMGGLDNLTSHSELNKDQKLGSRFSSPVSTSTVQSTRKAGIPKHSASQTTWTCNVWSQWAQYRMPQPLLMPRKSNLNCVKILLLWMWML